MLVVSRKPNEKLVFPGIDTVVRVVSVKSNVVRLGIDAPPDVAVYREELLTRIAASESAANEPHEPPAGSREFRHRLRNRLNAAAIGLALLERQQRAGMTEAAEATLARVNEEFSTLQGYVERMADPPAPVRKTAKVRRALLVEDDRNERELLAGFLRVAGIDVASVGDGSEALDYLHTHDRPDAVLLDMGLPRCDGPTTVRALRHSPAHAGLKIFAVSGYPPEHFGLDHGPTGIDRWFQKPLDPERLLVELDRELNIHA
ncbi:response regulator [Fimbriiglobus ruber]|uniref:Translational regulator CsrA n=1 Tax=Fimbriiglobus ruber TaxID=1908690 RepID=A0A225DT84_9BACT|nr:response regulator [Fimbriiglobus ruber]OWK44541.1 Chemotaxis protein methyltransferase CheR [Fimbriiglobus ruber]